MIYILRGLVLITNININRTKKIFFRNFIKSNEWRWVTDIVKNIFTKIFWKKIRFKNSLINLQISSENLMWFFSIISKSMCFSRQKDAQIYCTNLLSCIDARKTRFLIKISKVLKRIKNWHKNIARSFSLIISKFCFYYFFVYVFHHVSFILFFFFFFSGNEIIFKCRRKNRYKLS